jgi:hypothetical protein
MISIWKRDETRDVETHGTNNPKNFEKATTTAAMVPV